MRKLTICVKQPSAESSGDLLLWSGWQGPSKALLLEKMLSEQLISIRQEHMQWAYDTGQMQMDSGHTLQDLLVQGQTPSMWWTSLIYERHPKLSPDLYTIYKLRCIEILLRNKGYDEIELTGASRQLAKALHDLCQKLNIKFSCAKTSFFAQVRPLPARLYWILPASLRAMARYAHWWLTVRKKLGLIKTIPQLPVASPKLPATIVSYFPNIDMQAAGRGRFRSRYWESLHDALNEEARLERPEGPHFVHWLLIRFPSPHLSLSQCLELTKLFQKEGKDGLSFSFIEQFLRPSDLFAALWRWLKISLKSAAIESRFASLCHFEKSDLDFWPFMREQWAESMRGWRCLERCLLNRAFRQYARLAGPQRWTLFALENCPWERMVTEAAHMVPHNGPVFGAQHSTIRPTDFRYFDAPETFYTDPCAIFQPDIIAGNGQGACKQWQANNMPQDRLRQVEALRYIYLAKMPKRPVNGEIVPPEPGSPWRPAENRCLLVLTSFFADETRHHLELLGSSLEAGVLDGWSIILKPHPYGPVQWWLETLPTELQERVSLSLAPLAEELIPGVTVWASNSTTASLEAALLNLPLMVMAPYGDFNLCPIQDIEGLVTTASIEDVRMALAAPMPLKLPQNYLDLDPELPAWRTLLDLVPAKRITHDTGN